MWTMWWLIPVFIGYIIGIVLMDRKASKYTANDIIVGFAALMWPLTLLAIAIIIIKERIRPTR